jgi:peptide/nickel transport system permease protein
VGATGPLAARLRRLLRHPAGVVGLVITMVVVAVAVLAGVLAPGDPFASVARPLLPPSWSHPMGTDDFGRDVLAGVVHGARTSMVVVGWVMLIAGVLGVAVGAVAGYFGGILDELLMRVTDLFQSVPRFFLAVLVVALFGAGLDNLILVLGVSTWPWLARVVRADVLSMREREFVTASRALGASDARILARHVIPNVLPSAIVMVSLLASTVILLEAGLGFIGLSDPAAMSWGYLTNNAQRFLRVAWWMSVFPGAAIAVAVLGINLLGDAVNDVLNPRSVTGLRK